MSNLLMTKGNFADGGVLSDPDGEWSSDLPLDNLQSDLSSVVARTNDGVTDTRFVVDLGDRKSINLIVLDNHNLPVGGEWRWEIADDAGFTDVDADSGFVEVWPETETFGDEPYGEFVWGGKIETSDGDMALALPDAAMGRYVRISLRDPDATVSYIEAGRLIIDSPFRPSVGVQVGAEIRWRGAGEKNRTTGGAAWTAEEERYRELRLPLDLLSQDEIMGSVYEVQRTKGIGAQVFVSYEPDNETQRHRKSFLGTLVNLPPITRNFIADLYGTELVVAESRG